MGELTIKGVTKPAEIPFTFTSDGNSGVFKGHFTIKREDFNVGKPGGSVGSLVTINLVVPVKK
jgi:polyisoprenoid-binding protein YceI